MSAITPQDAEILRVLCNVGFIGKRPTRRHCEGLIEDDGKHRHRLYWATDAGWAALVAWAAEHGGEG